MSNWVGTALPLGWRQQVQNASREKLCSPGADAAPNAGWLAPKGLAAVVVAPNPPAGDVATSTVSNHKHRVHSVMLWKAGQAGNAA